MLHPSCTSLSVKLSYFSTRMDPVQVCPTKSHPPKLPSPLALRRSAYSQSVSEWVSLGDWDGKRRGKRGKGKVFPAAEGQFPLPSFFTETSNGRKGGRGSYLYGVWAVSLKARETHGVPKGSLILHNSCRNILEVCIEYLILREALVTQIKVKFIGKYLWSFEALEGNSCVVNHIC